MHDIIVIGAGAGGLVVAIGAAKAGKKVLLVEKGHYGGDCTNFGCIPSKSLIASAEVAHHIKTARDFGVELTSSEFNADKSLERVRKIVNGVRSGEDQDALKKHGVETLSGHAQFINPKTIEVTLSDRKETLSAKKFVIAAGSSPIIPPVEGLDQISYLTNETIFDLQQIPKSILFIGAGPISCELAQAFCRLGSEVTLIASRAHLMPHEFIKAQEVIEKQFQKEGITVYTEKRLTKVEKEGDRICVTIGDKKLTAEHLFIGTGRKPNVELLNLDAAKVKWSPDGIEVDAYGRTITKHIWAIGDITGAPFFTHNAEHQGRTCLSNLLLPFKTKKSCLPIPRVTFTDPEVASVGINPAEATKKHAVYTIPFDELDRAITAGRTEGFITIVTKKWSSKIVGATIVSPRAGEMLSELLVAMFQNIPLKHLAKVIHPYPTWSLGIRKAADKYLIQTILPLFKTRIV